MRFWRLHLIGLFIYIFLAFLLAIPPEYINYENEWRNFIGSFHPAIVHTPIGLWFGVILVLLIGTFNKKIIIKPWIQLLSVGVLITSIFSYILGFLLYTTNEYGGVFNTISIWGIDILFHAFTSLIFIILVTLFNIFLFNQFKLIKTWIFVLIVSLSLNYSGHQGGVISHGEVFKKFPPYLERNKKIVNSDQLYLNTQQVFYMEIYPILESKCIVCHNNRKSMGNLNLTTIEDILVGGVSGPALIFGMPYDSLILQRVSLPINDPYHMPPSEPFLTINELRKIENWITHHKN